MYPAYTVHIQNTHASKKRPFSWPDEGRPISKPHGPQSQDPRSVYLPLRLVQDKFHIGTWKCSRESWVVVHHQIYGFPPEKITKISRTQVHILWGGVPPKKIFSAEILGPNIESAVHSTKPEDEFRPGKGLNTKFRREFFSAEVRYTICVVAFRWKPNYTKVRKNCLQSIRGHKISISAVFFQQISCP